MEDATMAGKLTPQELGEIVARQKPGFEVETPGSDAEESGAMADRSQVETNAPDLAYLAAKFLNKASVQTDSASTPNDSQIVRVRPAGRQSTDSPGTGSRKVVVVSAKKRKIIGEQG
jgi:hypothetical protein